MTTTIETCYGCGGPCVTAGSNSNFAKARGVPVKAIMNGHTYCDICVGNEQLAHLEQGLSEIVYIADDGRSFNTWGGTKLGTVQELGGKDGVWPFRTLEKIMARLPVKVVHWAGITEDGVHVYGKTMGHNMAATAHVRRKRGRTVVEPGSPAAER